MICEGLRMEDSISIDTLYSVHYDEYRKDFSLEGEAHDFWEMVYVDRGTAKLRHGTQVVTLEKDEVFILEPNKFHDIRGNGNSASDLFIISFSCGSPAMDVFRNAKLKVNETERGFLANMLLEAGNCFRSGLDTGDQSGMPLSAEEPFGARQLLVLYLEQFFIHLYRRCGARDARTAGDIWNDAKAGDHSDALLLKRVVEYMEEHLSSRLTIEQICRDNLLGRSKLQKIFQKQCGMGPIEYFISLKIRYAKRLIRAGSMNFTQIADMLGYASIHYFSRQFKQVSGMTPSEYSHSIRAMAEKTE